MSNTVVETLNREHIKGQSGDCSFSYVWVDVIGDV